MRKSSLYHLNEDIAATEDALARTLAASGEFKKSAKCLESSIVVVKER